MLAGESALLGDSPVAVIVADVLAGSSFLAVGIVALGRPSARRFAAIAYLAGVAWFMANLVGVADVVHRPLLVHAVLSFPTGRADGRLRRVAVAGSWVAAVALAPVPRVGGVIMGVAVVVAGAAGVVMARAVRHQTDVTARAATALGVAIGGAALLGLLDPVSGAAHAVAVAYACLVAVAGVALLAPVLFGDAQRFELADNVVELTELAGDDVAGMVASLRRDDETDQAQLDVVAAVSRLLQDNRSLHVSLEAQVEEVRRSRRRLMDAADSERRRLARHLAAGAGRHLHELSVIVAALRAMPGHDRELVGRIDAEVAATRDDLEQLARGLHPRLLVEGGLRPSLEDLARRAHVLTMVRAPDTRFSATVETTVWYLCAEAAANVAKHARAASMAIDVALDGESLVATVTDDGVGGARPTAGSGLSGLVDRLRAVDGRLELTDLDGGGTQLRAWVPVA